MKINPVNIQAYQQTVRRDQADKPASQVDQGVAARNTVGIDPQQQVGGSKLAVKAPSTTYADMLSPEERQALDMLFAKYRDGGRFGPAYQAGGEGPADEATVGRLVDVKV